MAASKIHERACAVIYHHSTSTWNGTFTRLLRAGTHLIHCRKRLPSILRPTENYNHAKWTLLSFPPIYPGHKALNVRHLMSVFCPKSHCDDFDRKYFNQILFLPKIFFEIHPITYDLCAIKGIFILDKHILQ